MKIFTHRRVVVAAAISAVAIALPSIGASAASVSPASRFKAAAQSRTQVSLDQLKYMPSALRKNQTVRVLIQFDDATVATLAKADRAAGRKVTAATKQADRLAVRAAQAPTIRALAIAGAKVERRYTDVLSGVAATVKAKDLAAIAKVPGVVAVSKVSLFTRDNGNSNNHTGAAAAWAEYGATGAGVKVAIIDSGIDYGHADFGGSGLAADFEANDTTTTLDAYAFPTAKVVAGYDFVGDDYDASGEGAALVPVPDPDPMDCDGHGSHVAGTTAGLGVKADGTTYTGAYTQAAVNAANLRIHPGSAPNASLMAYRVFGCAGSVDSSIIVAAIDRAVMDGAHVINMSLGSAYGSPRGVEQTAVANAVAAGVTVVASAGNNAFQPYLTGAPASASAALSVAAADAIPTFPGAVLTSGAATLQLQNSNGATIPSGELAIKVLGDGQGGVSLGCAAEDYVDVTGKIAVVLRGACDRVDRAILGQAAGAAAVIMINTSDALPPYEDVIPGVTIPFLGLPSGSAAALLALDGLNATLAANVVNNPMYTDPADFTSSGPRNMDGAIKPDLSSPGVSVYSVAVGTGNDYTVYSGTSMAAPHVAGIAALVKGAHPGWSAQNIKNALVSTASTESSMINAMYPSRIIGNGMVDPQAALDAQVVFQATKAGDAGLSFGVQQGKSFSEEAKVRLINLTDHDVEVDLSAAIGGGATIKVKPSRVTLEPGVNRIEVKVRMSEAAVANMPFPSDSDIPSVIGRVTASVEGAPDSTMLVQLVQYNRSDVEVWSRDHNISRIKVRNEGNGFGTADFYELLARDGKDAGTNYDFRALGAQYFIDGNDALVVMALNSHNKFNNGAEMEYDVYIDSDGDGNPDFIIFALDYGLVMDGYTDGTLGVFVYNVATEDLWVYPGSAPMDGSTVFLPMFASDLGLASPSAVGTVLAVETYSIYNDGLSDFNLYNATFSPMNPQRSTGDWLELAPGDRAVVPVGAREPGENEVRSLGWMVVAQNDRSGGSQASLVRDHHDEDDD